MVTKDATQNEHQHRLTTTHGRQQGVKPRATTATHRPSSSSPDQTSTPFWQDPPPKETKSTANNAVPYFDEALPPNRNAEPLHTPPDLEQAAPHVHILCRRYLQSKSETVGIYWQVPTLPATHTHTHKMFPQHIQVGDCHPNAAIPKTDGRGGKPPNCHVQCPR